MTIHHQDVDCRDDLILFFQGALIRRLIVKPPHNQIIDSISVERPISAISCQSGSVGRGNQHRSHYRADSYSLLSSMS